MWLIGLIAILFCSAPGLAEPTINPDGVRNAASLAPNGTLNSGLAQGSVFVIRGSGLGPQTAVTASSFPLGVDLAGASVKISAGSNSYDAWIISAADQQVTALMPSNTPPGDARVTVTYQGQASAAAHVRIVAVNVGLFTVNDAGSGAARAQNLNSSDDQQANTLLNPARPGQAVALRATGVGVASGDESAGPLPGNLANTRLTVYVGGVEAKIRYVGRSDCCAGIDQIVFEVPGEVDGCYVPVAIVGPGVLSTPENATIPNQHTVSNFATISVSADGSACTDALGLTSSQLTNLQQSGGARVGAISLERRITSLNTRTEDIASARFGTYTITAILASQGIFGLPSLGSCLNFNFPLSATGPADPVSPTALDAGSVINISGPGETRSLRRSASGAYSAHLGGSRDSGQAQDPNYLDAGGQYTLDNGPGGQDVGAFSATVSFPAALRWINKSDRFYERSIRPLFRWEGGSDSPAVISGIGFNDLIGSGFVCTANALDGNFTVPTWAYIGTVMHTSAAPGVISLGTLRVTAFTAPGLDAGFILTRAMNEGVFVP